MNYQHFRSENNFRGGGSLRQFDSSPAHSSDSGGMFRQMGGIGGGRFDSNDLGLVSPLSGQKRGYPFSGRERSPDRFDRGSYAKLFIGSIPRTATEEDIRPLFEEHGKVVEVALIRDKRTGQQQGCCFIKYATSEDADRAIKSLHNQLTLPGGVSPIQVRYADGERERLGATEYKLFVGSLNKHASEKEVEELFSPYGRVEEVYLMRDELKQSRGCGFVKYSHREMALEAISALSGRYTMRGCEQPLNVRFADPKKPRSADSRGSVLGGPGFNPRFQAPGHRPLPSLGDAMRSHIPPDTWHPMSPSSDAGIHGFGGQLLPRPGDMPLTVNAGSQRVFNVGPAADGPFPGQPASRQHRPSLQPLPQDLASYSHTQMSHASLQQHDQLQLAHSTGQRLPSVPPSLHQFGVSRPLSISQSQFLQNPSSDTALQIPSNINIQSHAMPIVSNQKQLPSAPVQQQVLQPPQQSSSQLAHKMSQQTQALQATLQSSQQALSQLQQQLQHTQPSNQGVTLPQNSLPTKHQWPGIEPWAVASTPASTGSIDVAVSTTAAVTTQNAGPGKCNWTEHTSPDGFKYYYNGMTGESKWEKPEEFVFHEQQQQQQQKASVLQLQSHPVPQFQSPQQVLKKHQAQLQTQFQNYQYSQQPSLSSPYQSSGIISHQNVQERGHTQLQGASGKVIDPSHLQQVQGVQASQEWMWKNKPAGT